MSAKERDDSRADGDDRVVQQSLSGNVHFRDSESGSSPGANSPRRRRLLHDGSENESYTNPKVLSFAARNRRGRFYIPLTDNSFGGIEVRHVLFDSGCSSILLPFPLSNGFPRELFSARFSWAVSASRGTGALHSPVLKIVISVGVGFECTLGGAEQPKLRMLRFHVGKEAARYLLDSTNIRERLDIDCINKLNDFLGQLGERSAPERTYALLGQSYLKEVMFCQMDDVALGLSKDVNRADDIVDIIARYHRKIEPLVNQFEGFDDLEDGDGDEDEDDYRLSWDHHASSDDEIDEPDGR